MAGEQRWVSLLAGTEAKIRAEPNDPRRNPTDFANEIICCAGPIGRVETGDDDVIGAEGAYPLDFLIDRSEGAGTAQQSLGRWIECVDDRGNAETLRI